MLQIKYVGDGKNGLVYGHLYTYAELSKIAKISKNGFGRRLSGRTFVTDYDLRPSTKNQNLNTVFETSGEVMSAMWLKRKLI